MFKTLNPCLAACSAAVLLLGLLSEVVEAQERSPGFRKLAPGVITRISPHIQEEETFSGPREMVELTVGAPQLDCLAPKTSMYGEPPMAFGPTPWLCSMS